MNTKNTQLLLLIAIFPLFLLSCSQEKQVMTMARNHLNTLCSDGFYGRGYTHNGMQIAQNYLENQFSEIGLEKINGSYTEPFEYPINVIDSASLRVDNQSFDFGYNFLVSPSSPSISLKSIRAKEIHNLGDLEKNTLPILDFREGNKQQKENQKIILNYIKTHSAQLKISAVILVKKGLTHGLSSEESDFVEVTVNQEIKEGSVINLEVKSHFVPRFSAANVRGYIKGKSSDSAVIVSAHYDHLGQVGNAVFRGANDNASGTSMLLVLAKYFKKHRPRYDIYFYAFAGEEAGLYGSIRSANQLPMAQEKIKIVLNLDIIGTGDDGIQIVNSKTYPRFLAQFREINQKNQLLKEIKARGKSCNSDHCPFDMKGIPALFIYTLGGVSHYHNPLDNPETLALTDFYDLYRLLVQFLDEPSK